MAATGACTYTHDKANESKLHKHQWSWTTDESGDVTSVGTAYGVTGRILAAQFEPGTGSSQPNASYDLQLYDSKSIDVLGGAGSNLANSANTRVAVPTDTYFLPILYEANITPKVANGGDTKTGVAILYTEEIA